MTLILKNDVVNEVSEFFVPDELMNDTDEKDKAPELFSNGDNQKFLDINDEPLINDLGEWVLSESDIECIGIGAGILGCGGGGNPHLGKLMGKMAVREGKTIQIITPENLKCTIERKAANQGKQCNNYTQLYNNRATLYIHIHSVSFIYDMQ